MTVEEAKTRYDSDSERIDAAMRLLFTVVEQRQEGLLLGDEVCERSTALLERLYDEGWQTSQLVAFSFHVLRVVKDLWTENGGGFEGP
jgi:hypothetical protein